MHVGQGETTFFEGAPREHHFTVFLIVIELFILKCRHDRLLLLCQILVDISPQLFFIPPSEILIILALHPLTATPAIVAYHTPIEIAATVVTITATFLLCGLSTFQQRWFV